MIANTIDRKQPNIVIKSIRRVIRMRVVQLSLVVLPQVICLAALACIFYFLRVQDTFVAPVDTYSIGAVPSLRCVIRPEEATKVSRIVPVQIDLLGPDDGVLASGQGTIRSLSKRTGETVMDVEGPGLAAVVRQANGMESPRVRIKTRVRRVVDLFTAKGSTVR